MNSNQRPIWILIFAILLACVATRVKSQAPNIRYTADNDASAGIRSGRSHETPPEIDGAETQGSQSIDDRKMTSIRLNGQVFQVPSAAPVSAPPHPVRPTQLGQPILAGPTSMVATSAKSKAHASRRSRPKTVRLQARLENLDADPEPDGWIAELTLLDAWGEPVSLRANARFELHTRAPTDDFTGYVDANAQPVKWNIPLVFNADGYATATLRLKTRLPRFDRDLNPNGSVIAGDGPLRASPGQLRPSRLSGLQTGDLNARSLRRMGAMTSAGTARFGSLKTSISVPSEGVFKAITPIILQPSVLVDTQWPYQ